MAELKKCELCGKEFKNMEVHMRKHEKKEVKFDNSVEKKLDEVVSTINILASAVGKLVELQTADKKPEQTVKSDSTETYRPKLDDVTYPSAYIPPKFRNIVDEVLSPEFGIKIEDFENTTDFQFSVIVPDKYSSVIPTDRQKGVVDIRSRIIPRALGENGVREWCMLIRNNLNKYYSKEGVGSPFTNN